MTLVNKNRMSEYTGDGSQTEFAFDFRINQDSDLRVFLDGTEQTLNTHYTVVGNPGNVVMTTPPDSGAKLLIIRDTPPVQSVSLPNTGAFPAQVVEKSGLDKVCMVLQALRERADRALKFAFKSATADIDLPEPVAYSFFRFNSAANGLELRLLRPSAPSGPTATGAAGDFAFDSSYLYVCVSTNTWRRTALSSW